MGRLEIFGAAANFAYNHNEITDLGGVDYLETGYSQRNAVGLAMNSYYLYQADGFFNSQEEAITFADKSGNPFGGGDFKAGDIRYVDTDGNGTLNGKDRVMANSSDPVYTFGLNLNAGWKGFDLSLMFNGAAKVCHVCLMHTKYMAPSQEMPDIPQASGKTHGLKLTTMLPCLVSLRILTLRVVLAMPVSTFWLQNTNYLRLKNLPLGLHASQEPACQLGNRQCTFLLLC